MDDRASFTCSPGEFFPGHLKFSLSLGHVTSLSFHIVITSLNESFFDLCEESFWVLIELVSNLFKTFTKSIDTINDVKSCIVLWLWSITRIIIVTLIIVVGVGVSVGVTPVNYCISCIR